MESSVFVLCTLLALAGLCDLRGRKVPNFLVLCGFALGLWLRGFDFFWAALLTFLPCYFLFELRLLGAGDGKVCMLIAGYLGFPAALWAFFFGLLSASVLSLRLLFRCGDAFSGFASFALWVRQMVSLKEITKNEKLSFENRDRCVPVAACMAAGTAVYVLGRLLCGP